MLPLDAEFEKVEAQAPSVPMEPERLNDMVIANAIVHDIQHISGVLEMGQGGFAKAATYGPGRRIRGIVLRRPAPDELSVEIHVVLDETTFIKVLTDASPSSTETPVLLRITDTLRATVSQTFAHLGLPAPILVDVTIEDIR